MESGSKAEQKVAMLRKRKAERQARSKEGAEEKAAAAVQKAAGAFAHSATSDITQLAAATFIQKTLRGKIVCCPAAAVTAARSHTACAHPAQAGTPCPLTHASAASKSQWHG